MYEAGHRHILILHPHRVGNRLSRHLSQAVSHLLAVHVYASALAYAVGCCRLVTRNLGIAGSAGIGLLLLHVVFVEVAPLVFSLSPFLFASFALLAVALGFHGKLLRLDLFLRHLHLALEAHIVTV